MILQALIIAAICGAVFAFVFVKVFVAGVRVSTERMNYIIDITLTDTNQYHDDGRGNIVNIQDYRK